MSSSYLCAECDGWHLTSQAAQPTRPLPYAKFTAPVPGPAAEAIRRMAGATGISTAAA